jgi:hypothetical protein
LPRLPGRTSTRDATTPARPLGEGEQPGSIAVTGGWTEEDFRRNLEAARASAPRRKPKTCKDCGLHEKQLGHPLWCTDCWLRRQPVEVQAAACARRAAAVPPDQRREKVPEPEWPEGHRWCRACQSYRLLLDFKDDGSRCRACVATAAHGAYVERTYEIDRFDYDALVKLQGNRCAICRKEFKQRPNIDHDHVSNKVRGLLCDKCNYELLGAAAAAGDPSSEGAIRLLLLAIHYLRNPPMSGRWRPGQAIHDEPPF